MYLQYSCSINLVCVFVDINYTQLLFRLKDKETSYSVAANKQLYWRNRTANLLFKCYLEKKNRRKGHTMSLTLTS